MIVTANPDQWDGDMRTWEALASGALVLVDASHTPFPPGLALVHGGHVVFYDNRDRASLLGLLRHYLDHPEEAAAIAKRGQAFALQHHRASSRIDYVDAVVRGDPLLHAKEWRLAGQAQQQQSTETAAVALDGERVRGMAAGPPPWAAQHGSWSEPRDSVAPSGGRWAAAIG